MQLISPLASGVVGASGGTATIKTRGTATYATVYSDWDGRHVISTGAPLTLDVNGGLIAYVQAPVDVVVKDAVGSTIRSWTEAISAESVEYRGPSFTGIDQITLASGRGANYPVNLDTILDLWATSSSAYDFHVDVDGADLDLDDLPLPGYFYNVKDYGAVGDGTTDDKAAINAAIAAANTHTGGIVWFPHGTYRITGYLTWYRGVSLFADGTHETVIEIDHAADYTLRWTNAVSTDDRIYFVKGIRFTANVATYGFIDLSTNNPNNNDIIYFDSCVFDGTNTDYLAVLHATSGTNPIYRFSKCDLKVGVYQGIYVTNTGASAKVQLNACNISLAINGARGAYATVKCYEGDISNCVFDMDNSTSTFNIIEAYNSSARPLGLTICDNIFDGGDATQVAIALGTFGAYDVFSEDGNEFLCTPYSYTMGANTPVRINLGSRRGKQYSYVNNGSATITVNADLAETIYIEHINDSDITVSMNVVPIGNKLTVVITNNSPTPAARNGIMSGTYWDTSSSQSIAHTYTGTWHGVATVMFFGAGYTTLYSTISHHVV